MTAETRNKRYVRAQVLADRWDITVRAVEIRAAKGLIPCIRIGKSLRFDLAAVIEAVEGKKP